MVQPIETVSRESRSPSFAHKVWVTVGIVTAVFLTLFLLWFALKDILTIFAGVLLAVFLHGIGSWIANRSFLSRKVALILLVILLLGVVLLGGFLLIPNLAEQGSQLSEQLRTSVTDLETRLSDSTVGQTLLDQAADLQPFSGNSSSILSGASTIFSTTLDAFVRVIIVLFVGFYLAYEPKTYMSGLLKLAPQARRAYYHETLDKVSYALRWWLVGRLASMTIVGVLSIVGLMLLDVPLAFILGLIAGLLAFIPLLGPTLALLLPLLVALADSPQKAFYVLLLYMGIQFVESYFLTPVIQRRVTALPPVLLIGSQVLLGLFAGLLGIILAAPLAVMGMVMVKMLYVEDVLQDHSVEYLEDSRQQNDTPDSQETKVHTAVTTASKQI